MHEWKLGVWVHLNTPCEDNLGGADQEKQKWVLPRWRHTILFSPLSARQSSVWSHYFCLASSTIPWLKTGHNGFSTIKFMYLFIYVFIYLFISTFLTSITDCLIITPSNRWRHCNACGRQRSWLYLISAHSITSRISSSQPNFKILTSLLTSGVVPTAKKCLRVQFGHRLTFRSSTVAWCLYNRSAIAYQASHSLSTTPMESLLECLSHLVSALQDSHCHWIYRSTWAKFRAHPLAFDRAVSRVVVRSLKMCNLILHHDSPFLRSSFIARQVTLAKTYTSRKFNVLFLIVSSTVLLECLLEWSAPNIFEVRKAKYIRRLQWVKSVFCCYNNKAMNCHITAG